MSSAAHGEAWGGEATAFTPLLAQAEMLDYLGEETGIGRLTPIDVEHRTGTRSADILAETVDGRRVIIENQYGSGNHDHLTRALAYAVATDARLLVVVAEDHRDEFVSVANYLNEVGGLSVDNGISVWLVKVRAVRRVGDLVWSPEFIVQAEPNEWEAALRRESPPTFESLDDFYRKCAATSGSDWADTTRTIIEDWLQRPRTKEHHHTQQTVSLHYPSPRNPSGINVLQLNILGHVYVTRDYIWRSSGVFDPTTEPIDLDDRIRLDFPSARWGEKKSSITILDATPEQVHSFLDWITTRFDQATDSA